MFEHKTHMWTQVTYVHEVNIYIYICRCAREKKGRFACHDHALQH